MGLRGRAIGPNSTHAPPPRFEGVGASYDTASTSVTVLSARAMKVLGVMVSQTWDEVGANVTRSASVQPLAPAVDHPSTRPSTTPRPGADRHSPRRLNTHFACLMAIECPEFITSKCFEDGVERFPCPPKYVCWNCLKLPEKQYAGCFDDRNIPYWLTN